MKRVIIMDYQDRLLIQDEANFLIETLLNKTERGQITWECEHYYVWNHLAQTEPCNQYEIWNEIGFCTSFHATIIRLEVFIRLRSIEPVVATVEVSVNSYVGPQCRENYTLISENEPKQLALSSLLHLLMGQCALLCPRAATNIQYFARNAQGLGCISYTNALLIRFALAAVMHKKWESFYRISNYW